MLKSSKFLRVFLELMLFKSSTIYAAPDESILTMHEQTIPCQ